MLQTPLAKTTASSNDLNRTAFWLLCLAPALWLLVFYSLVLRVRLELGHWPQPGNPDPMMLNLAGYQAAIYFCTAFALVSPIGVLAFTLLHRGLNISIRKPLTLFAASGLLMALLIRFDPASFLHWFGA